MENSIKVFNLGGLPTAPLDSFIELQEDFKKPDADKLSKLQMLIITRGFKYSFKVWKDPDGKLWIIDAHQRRKALLGLRSYGFKIAQCCIWVKDSLVMGRQDYQWQHEPCLYGWKPGAAHFWNSDRKQTTIWNFDKPKANRIHPTMKPIALMAYPITNSTKNGDIVVDVFSGSGSTIMACQQTDRIGYGMEIDPKYVSATVRRYMAMFPQQPILLERDGNVLSEDDTKKTVLCQN